MIEHAIAVFVGLLNSNWVAMQSLSDSVKQQGLPADWAQASWETIVEASLPATSPPIRLEVYGDGADCHPGSSRASFPGALPTHALQCRPANDFVLDYLSGKPISRAGGAYAFDRFVSVKDGWYFESPIFDHVLLEREGEEYVIKLSEVEWELAPIGNRNSGV